MISTILYSDELPQNIYEPRSQLVDRAHRLFQTPLQSIDVLALDHVNISHHSDLDKT